MFSSDSSEYRALRRSYLLLEEDSFALERELKMRKLRSWINSL
ncbi:unnamed protein product [Brassica rapa subsp. trilocularis]